MSENRFGSFTGGFLLGMALGAVCALLFAPARGEQTQRRLREQGIELTGQGRERAQRALTRSKEVAADMRGSLTSTVEKVRARLRPPKASGETAPEEVTTPPQGEAGESD